MNAPPVPCSKCGHRFASHRIGGGCFRGCECTGFSRPAPSEIESGPLSEPRTGAESSDPPKVGGTALLAFILAERLGPTLKEVTETWRSQTRTDLRELLIAVEDAGREGAIESARMSGQRLVELALSLRERYPE